MKQFAVSYDLHKPGRNYDNLIAAIKQLSGSWCHTLESLWMIKSNLSATQVRDRLLTHIDANDSLIVSELTGVAAWHGIDKDQSDWLKSA